VYGLSINMLSLFGMIIVVGILVDDGVVVGENIYQHYEDGEPALKAAIDGTIEVMPSISAGIATTAVAFGFFFFIEGITGDYFSDLSFVVIASITISLLEVILLLPSRLAHSKALQKKVHKPNKLLAFTNKLMLNLRDKLYLPHLGFFIKNKLFGLLIITAAFILTFSAMGAGLIRSTFFPDIELDRIIVNLELPTGTREHVTDSVLRIIEAATSEVNEEWSAERIDGLQVIQTIEREIGPMRNEGRLKITLLDVEARMISAAEITSAVRSRAGEIPGVEQLSYEAGIPFGKPVAVSLSSRDIGELRAARTDFRRALENMPELTDVLDNEMRGQPEIHLKLKDDAHKLNLNLQQVTSQVRSGFFGREVQRLQRGLDEVIIWLRYDETERTSLGGLERMRIRTADGEFPLGELAEIEWRDGITAINHRDGRRAITVEADVVDRSVSIPDVTDYIRETILPQIKARHPGINYEFEGQAREFGKTLDSIFAILPAVFILMIAILVFTFRSFAQAIALVVITPFAFIGAAWGHFLHGIPFSIFSGLGLIALIGILLNDGLVFVNAFNAKLKLGKPLMAAIMETGSDRFRPIFLTTITTFAGLTPLLLNQSLQAQFLIPLAVTVAYGLVVGSTLTLIMLPILILVFNSIRVWASWLITGKKPEPESVEPAIKEQKYELDEKH
nr:efflux RND transporter permease subunit [Bacteroidota bacterium]